LAVADRAKFHVRSPDGSTVALTGSVQ